MGFKVASRVRGLSDEAFREAFGAEEQCRSALSRLRWPDGFVCPAWPTRAGFTSPSNVTPVDFNCPRGPDFSLQRCPDPLCRVAR